MCLVGSSLRLHGHKTSKNNCDRELLNQRAKIDYKRPGKQKQIQM